MQTMRNHRAFKVLHYRDFRLVTYGQIFGNLGFWMDELSRGWLIYQLTDSMVQLGLARGVQFVPLLLFAPFAGSAADRYSRKTLLLFSQAANGCLFAALAVLIYNGMVQPWHVYLTAVLVGMMQVIQQPARTSLVCDTVPPEYLTNAIGLTSLIFNGARLAGPALAGVSRWPIRCSMPPTSWQRTAASCPRRSGPTISSLKMDCPTRCSPETGSTGSVAWRPRNDARFWSLPSSANPLKTHEVSLCLKPIFSPPVVPSFGCCCS